MKSKQKLKNKIFEISYLENEELTEEDLRYIFDTASLNNSLIVGMFKHAGYAYTSSDILNMVKTDSNWTYKYFWTAHKAEQYLQSVINVMRNVKSYNLTEATSFAYMWIANFGLTNSKMKGKKVNKLCTD